MCELHEMIHRLQGLIEFSGVRNRGRVVQSQMKLWDSLCPGFVRTYCCNLTGMSGDKKEISKIIPPLMIFSRMALVSRSSILKEATVASLAI